MENNQDESTEQFVQLDLHKIQFLIPQYSSEKLCEMVVSARYFSMDQKIIIMCMQELAIRRVSGSDFAFEKYIDDSYNSLPVLNFKLPDLRTTLQQLSKMKK